MKRLQIMIEEEIDDELERRAVAERTSKGALVRRFVRAGLGPLSRAEQDSIDRMIGADDYPPEPVDDVVYR
jgi:hypothetical protein